MPNFIRYIAQHINRAPALFMMIIAVVTLTLQLMFRDILFTKFISGYVLLYCEQHIRR